MVFTILSIYFLRLVLPNILYTLFERFMLVSAEANLSPLRAGSSLNFELNIFAANLFVRTDVDSAEFYVSCVGPWVL